MGWLRETGARGWRIREERIEVLGVPLLAVDLPRGDPARRLGQGARLLRKRGLRRALLPPGREKMDLARWGLSPVERLPLCRVLAPRLVLTLLKGLPLRERRVALRGEWAGAADHLADALCLQVGTLILDFDRGEEDLARALRLRRGAAPLRWGQAAPQVSVEFSPRQETAGKTLRLWGEPSLAGLTLWIRAPLPRDLPRLPFLALLWEAGRLRPEEVALRPGSPGDCS